MSASLNTFDGLSQSVGSTQTAAQTGGYDGILGGVRLYFARKHAIARLNKLHDHVLADIGIEREKINEIVHRNLRRA